MKTTTQFDTDIEGRKHGEQSGLETHVVHAVNDARSSDRNVGVDLRDIGEVGKGLVGVRYRAALLIDQIASDLVRIGLLLSRVLDFGLAV